jgi:hypothetical protein
MHLVSVVKEAKGRLRIKYSNYGTLNLPQSLLLSKGSAVFSLFYLSFLKTFWHYAMKPSYLGNVAGLYCLKV